MRKTIKPVTSFSVRLLLLLGLVFLIHGGVTYLSGVSIFNHLLIPAYLVNYFLVLINFTVIIILKNKKSQSLGFVFFGGFFLKMAVFLIFFNPVYRADEIIQKTEFAAFFIPFAACLAYETFVLVSILNKE